MQIDTQSLARDNYTASKTEVRLHICSMSMANIITSLTTYSGNNIPNSSNKRTKAKSHKQKKQKNRNQSKQSLEQETINKPLTQSVSCPIEKNTYSVREYFTLNKETKSRPKKNRFLLIKESPDQTKSPLIIGIIFRKKVNQNQEGICFHFDNRNDYAMMVNHKVQSALEKNKIRYKNNILFHQDSQSVSTFEFQKEYIYSFYPFSVPLKLDEIKKNDSKEKTIEKSTIMNDNLEKNTIIHDDIKESQLKTSVIQHFRLFIPSKSHKRLNFNDSIGNSSDDFLKRELYQSPVKKNDESYTLSYDGSFGGPNSEYLNKKRNRDN